MKQLSRGGRAAFDEALRPLAVVERSEDTVRDKHEAIPRRSR